MRLLESKCDTTFCEVDKLKRQCYTCGKNLGIESMVAAVATEKFHENQTNVWIPTFSGDADEAKAHSFHCRVVSVSALQLLER